MAGGEPQAREPVNLRQGVQQPVKPEPGLAVFPRIDILPQKRDFAHALTHQSLGFGDNVASGA